jgi:hypothetical protein
LTYKPGVDGKKIFDLFSTASILKTGFEQARLKKPPYPLHFDESGNRAVAAKTVDDFLRKAEVLIAETEASFNEAIPTSRGERPSSSS